MSVMNDNDGIYVELPCTLPTGKIRLKERDSFMDYGRPLAPRQTKLTQRCYIEWQIGYDLLDSAENRKLTSLKDLTFTNYKGEQKLMYELAEILYYSYARNLLSPSDIRGARDEIRQFSYMIDSEDITRSYPKETNHNGFSFYEMKVVYPLLVHKFMDYDIHAEIAVREQQRAVGVQPMLYVCIPIANVQFEKSPYGRVLKSKETCRWEIGRGEAQLACEMIKIFGMLSAKHQYDVLQILQTLFNLN